MDQETLKNWRGGMTVDADKVFAAAEKAKIWLFKDVFRDYEVATRTADNRVFGPRFGADHSGSAVQRVDNCVSFGITIGTRFCEYISQANAGPPPGRTGTRMKGLIINNFVDRDYCEQEKVYVSTTVRNGIKATRTTRYSMDNLDEIARLALQFKLSAGRAEPRNQQFNDGAVPPVAAAPDADCAYHLGHILMHTEEELRQLAIDAASELNPNIGLHPLSAKWKLAVLTRAFTAYVADGCKSGGKLRIRQGFPTFAAWLLDVLIKDCAVLGVGGDLIARLPNDPALNETTLHIVECLTANPTIPVERSESILVAAAVVEALEVRSLVEPRSRLRIADAFSTLYMPDLRKYEHSAHLVDSTADRALKQFQSDLARSLNSWRVAQLYSLLDANCWKRLEKSAKINGILTSPTIDPANWHLVVSADDAGGHRAPDDKVEFKSLYDEWRDTDILVICGLDIDFLCSRCIKVRDFIGPAGAYAIQVQPTEGQNWMCSACGTSFPRGATDWNRVNIDDAEQAAWVDRRNGVYQARKRLQANKRFESFYKFIGHNPSWTERHISAICEWVRERLPHLLEGDITPEDLKRIRRHFLGQGDEHEAGDACVDCYMAFQSYVADCYAWGYRHEPLTVAFREKVNAANAYFAKIGRVPYDLASLLALPPGLTPSTVNAPNALARRGARNEPAARRVAAFRGFTISGQTEVAISDGYQATLTPLNADVMLAPIGKISNVHVSPEDRAASFTIDIEKLRGKNGVILAQSRRNNKKFSVSGEMIDGRALVSVTDVPGEIDRIVIEKWFYTLEP